MASAVRSQTNDVARFNAALRQDLYPFIRKTFNTVDAGQKFLPNWHTRVIAHYLERAYRREIKRLIITLHVRKSRGVLDVGDAGRLAGRTSEVGGWGTRIRT